MADRTMLHFTLCQVEDKGSGLPLPTDPTLWYNRNPQLLVQQELPAMARACPDAQLGLLQTNGSLYWLANISFAGYNHTFMLFYQNSFPDGSGNAPSVVIIPMVPTMEELRREVREDCALYFRRCEPLGAECLWLNPGTYSAPTAADYLAELRRWLEANKKCKIGSDFAAQGMPSI